MVGPTFRAIMIDQFTKLRDGDSLWWENKLWSPEDLQWIKGTTLSDIILRNTNTQAMQADAFVAVERADLYNGTVPTISARTYPSALGVPPAPTNPITFSIISGALPPGLAVVGNTIKGIPYGVVRDTTYTFCIRASNGKDIADRTFNILVKSVSPPEFVTPAGLLPVGANGQKYVLDNNFINYKIQAVNLDNQAITYYIASNDGKLPPGVTLLPNGTLTGFVDPMLKIVESVAANGEYDEDFYDSSYYDFASRPTNGYDSYKYASVDFDFNTPTLPPKAINQRYEFIVSAAVANKVVKRKFGIFVVSPELLTADDTAVTDDSTVFSADNTPLEAPLFVNDSNLGSYRANNYITIEISTFTSSTTASPTFTIDDVKNLPPGLQFAPVGSTVYLAGQVPFQAAISKVYSFVISGARTGNDIQPAITSKRFYVTMVGEVNNKISWTTDASLGSIPANFNSNLKVEAVATDSNAIIIYSLSPQSKETGLPPGLSLDVSGEITGKVNQFGVANIPRYTTFENGAWYIDRHYTTIDASHQYDIIGTKGLILFDSNTGFNIDTGNTTFDRTYTFTVKSTDQYGYAINSKQFTLQVSTPNQILYSNIRTQPYLKSTQRNNFSTFINDPTIFNIGSIYRPADPNFGVRTDLSMLIYAGVETTAAAAYIGAMGLNHKRKRFQFGTIKKGVAIENKTNVYEVVYIEMFDPLETTKQVLPHQVNFLQSSNIPTTADISNAIWTEPNTTTGLGLMRSTEPWLDRPINSITVDSTGYDGSNISDDGKYYPSNITNWRRNIEGIGLVERNYMPLWMRSIQPGQREQLGFKLAIPLCYCKPGTADGIILNIKHSGFDFRTIDYTVDRYIIDSVEGLSTDKYLVFRNDRINV
jgi:hypothetical protein